LKKGTKKLLLVWMRARAKAFCFFYSKNKAFLFLLACGSAHAQVQSVTLQPPARAFGYFIGDTITAGAVIMLAPGTELDARSLPTPGEITGGLDIRRVATTAQGNTLLVSIEYQTFTAPEEAMQVRVPAYTLTFHRGAAHFTAQIPFWSFYTSPFRHERQATIDPAVLRPDHAIPPLSPVAAQRGLAASLCIALAALYALASFRGWTPRLARHPGPFAQAARRIRATSSAEDALLALHRAFDATAGARLLPEDLDAFVRHHPQFQPLRDDIDAFFQISRARFFGAREQPGGPYNLVTLSKRLRRAERTA
jgi:mxaA protein